MPSQLLPQPRGPLSRHVADVCLGRPSLIPPVVPDEVLGDDDAQLALHCLYELSYRGYADVGPDAEADRRLVVLRRELEAAMESELRARAGDLPDDPAAHLVDLATTGEGPSLSHWVLEHPDRDQVRELLAHRSAYQLKEADPHSWAIPRLHGRPKRALLEIQWDEYGDGVEGCSHAELFAETLRSLDLDDRYGAYVDLLPAATLATGNLISLLGSERRLTPALVGHLALFEMTSVGPMGRYSAALEAIGAPPAARRFYDVHVEADAHHEVLALTELVDGLLEIEPDCGREISFGASALCVVEGAFTDHVLDAFTRGATSLRHPLPELVAPVTADAA